MIQGGIFLNYGLLEASGVEALNSAGPRALANSDRLLGPQGGRFCVPRPLGGINKYIYVTVL